MASPALSSGPPTSLLLRSSGRAVVAVEYMLYPADVESLHLVIAACSKCRISSMSPEKPS